MLKNNSILKEITLPNDCLLGIAIPLNKEDILLNWNNESADFIQHVKRQSEVSTPNQFWDLYKGITIKIKNLANELEIMGVKVIFDFNTKDINEISNYKVTTLFAHFSKNKNKLELANNLITPKDFSSYLPLSFYGILDLTVCFSTILQKEVKKN